MTKPKRRRARGPDPTPWQVQVQRDLTDIATGQADDLQLLEQPRIEEDGTRVYHLALSTAGLPERVPRGVPFRSVEEFWIGVEPTADRPPSIMLDHYRFLGVAHVMSGLQICLYQDASREWDPDAGIRGVLDRLWRWMEDAAADRFHADVALYHAVGGVMHVTDSTPTIVVRSLPDRGHHLDAMYLRGRTDARLDLLEGQLHTDDLHVPVVRLRRDIPVGAGRDVLSDLLRRLEATQGLRPVWPDAWAGRSSRRLFIREVDPIGLAEHAVAHLEQDSNGCGLQPLRRPATPRTARLAWNLLSPAAELAAALVASAAQNPMGSHQYAILSVPHPDRGPRHLLGLRLPPSIADSFRAAVADPDLIVDPYMVAKASPHMPMEWCRMSDERRQVTTRRDVGRPVEALVGKTVHVWGVGGLGSWIAEFVVRAGARRVVLHDPGRITGGLLVRQNYVEDDIGAEKADALVGRLQTIRDDVDVRVLRDLPDHEAPREMLAADLIIDATVSRVVARWFDQLSQFPDRRAVLAEIATDARTGALGLAIVNAPPTHSVEGTSTEGAGECPTMTAIDEAAGTLVAEQVELEAYRVFWEEPLAGDEFVPTRGCSVPTFHGSAADLAAVAASLLNFIALHLGESQSGTHLVSLPHSGVDPAHRYIAHPAAGQVRTDVA